MATGGTLLFGLYGNEWYWTGYSCLPSFLKTGLCPVTLFCGQTRGTVNDYSVFIKIFLRLWLAKIPLLSLYHQLALTEFGRCTIGINRVVSNCIMGLLYGDDLFHWRENRSKFERSDSATRYNTESFSRANSKWMIVLFSYFLYKKTTADCVKYKHWRRNDTGLALTKSKPAKRCRKFKNK